MSAVTDRGSIDSIVRERPEQLHDFDVATIDGYAGKVARHQGDVDDQHLVIHLDGPLGLFGKDVVIESDVIDEIDAQHRRIHVDRISQWVKQSPKLGESQARRPVDA